MTDEQFKATRAIEFAIKDLNRLVQEARAIGVSPILDLSKDIEVSATYGYQETPVKHRSMFE